MGVNTSVPLPIVGKASEFYWHCRNGVYSEFKAMLPKLTYEQLNQIEPNGSTALHAATFYNHLEIVQLLLDNGCSRTISNLYGKTAYQEAQTEEMRTLFDRPNSRRFIDENTTESFKLMPISRDNVAMEDSIPDDWVRGHVNAEDAHDSQLMFTIAQLPSLLRRIFQNRTETTCKQSLKELINKNVTRTHRMYRRINDLVDKFSNKTNVNHLLTLYTLETPIYTALQNDADAFTILLYLHLSELRARAYQGSAYRGGKMTDTDIQAYQWALNDQNYVLETRTVQSLTKSESVAQPFAHVRSGDNSHSVLLIFEFPNRCQTAIDLTQISSNLPSLSEYEKEEEVTLLPFTLFNVHEIKVGSTTGQYRITLKNVSVS